MSELKEKMSVILLQSNNFTNIVYLPGAIEDLGIRTQESNAFKVPSGFQHHHNPISAYLYICSNREIKVGDWYYTNGKTAEYSVHKCDSIRLANICQELKASKVEASTDKSLGLPEPSTEFIEKYVEKYNEGSPIEEVIVEMVLQHRPKDLKNPSEFSWGEGIVHSKINDELYNWRIAIKVRKDNTIIISKVEESWDDIISLGDKAWYPEHAGINREDFILQWITKNYSVPQKLKK